MLSLGIDCGSTKVKGVLYDGHSILKYAMLPVGTNPATQMLALYNHLYSDQVGYTVTTGYGRELLPQRDKVVTEITCHGKSAALLCPDADLVVDIGGQDCKAILLDTDGNVSDFLMNDKCAAGTGRFIEMMCRLLGCHEDLIDQFVQDSNAIHISSMCAVFAESEIISLLSQNTNHSDIAMGVIQSVCKRTANFARRLSPRRKVFFSGGLARFDSFTACLTAEFHLPVCTHPMSQYAGAIGAALIGMGKIKRI